MKYLNLKLFWTAQSDAGSPIVTPVNISSQTATGEDMSATMKDFYANYLLENAREQMVFTQLGEEVAIHGKTVEWRKFNTFAKALTPLTEGVVPTGEKFGMTKITASTTQHGSFVAISDRLELEAYDDQIMGATEEMGAAGSETYDTLTRNILIGANSVAYCPAGNTAVTAVSGITKAAILTPTMVDKAATWLKKNKAPKINGSYVAVIHPSVAFDLRESDAWVDVHKYADVKPIFNGEIGELHGVRFIESTAAKVHKGTGAGATKLTSDGNAYYETLFLGAKAFAVVKPDGESMEMIIKDRSQAGGPLNQYSTVGYKFCHGAKILYQERILRVLSGSSFGDVDEEN